MNRQIDKFVTVCEAVGERIEADEGVPKSKMVTIYNGVHLDKFTVQSKDQIMGFKRKVGIAKEDFVIGMVAHFRPEKNHDVFLRAIKTLKKSIKNLKVLAIGHGPTLSWCKEYCNKNGIKDCVIFTGRVENVMNYVAAMDIACLVPGSNEGFSNSIIEKMAMGIPVIATDVGGNKEAIVDQETGYIIPANDPDRLSEVILDLYKNPLKRLEMGGKARERTERIFSIEEMIKKHEKFYLEVLSKDTTLEHIPTHSEIKDLSA